MWTFFTPFSKQKPYICEGITDGVPAAGTQGRASVTRYCSITSAGDGLQRTGDGLPANGRTGRRRDLTSQEYEKILYLRPAFRSGILARLLPGEEPGGRTEGLHRGGEGQGQQLHRGKDLSEDELREIARLQGEYASAAFKEHAGKVIEKAGDVIDKTGAAIDGFVDGLKSDDKSKDK